jgi:hypothetical protein
MAVHNVHKMHARKTALTILHQVIYAKNRGCIIFPVGMHTPFFWSRTNPIIPLA